MQQKAFTLINKGMNRDLSISKAGESSAYENHNIRILARENDTLLSVTNERGNQEIDLRNATGFEGELIGWNVLNNHLILFTHDKDKVARKDFIYRIDYAEGDFVLRRGSQRDVCLYNGDLNFSLDNPIESVVYQETESIQKIYWVDGRNVLRFMNFMAEDDEIARWEVDNTCFDSNKKAGLGLSVQISKNDLGSTRANGVVQYLVTYFNKHGQESGYVYVSDLVYLSPYNHGGSADGTNSNRVTIQLSNLDTSYTSVRVYSVFRSALNGTVTAYLVGEDDTNTGNATVIDDGAHLTAEDSGRLLYLGSVPVVAGTITHKDQTLFLGDLKIGNKFQIVSLETAIKNYMRSGSESTSVVFITSDNSVDGIHDIPYLKDTGVYEYSSQLAYTSAEITTFKGNEKYRFAITFRRRDGSWTEAFWIGDKTNTIYPEINPSTGTVVRAVAKCTLHPLVLERAIEAGFTAVQLMIAEATYSDRSVKAQGIVNPTMFNVWERYSDRLYSQSSWITRPRNSAYAWKHFDVVDKSTNSTGEIACNYWESELKPNPYYRLKNYTESSIEYEEDFGGASAYTHLMVIYKLRWYKDDLEGHRWYYICCYLVFGTPTPLNSTNTAAISAIQFTQDQADIISDGSFYIPKGKAELVFTDEDDGGKYTLEVRAADEATNLGKNRTEKVTFVRTSIENTLIRYYSGMIPNIENYIPSVATFESWFNTMNKNDVAYYSNKKMVKETSLLNALNNVSGTGDPDTRWYIGDTYAASTNVDYTPSFYKKHLMFVDENVVTLNSPELEYEAVSIESAHNSEETEQYRFRIIGAAKITSSISDYTVEAEPGHLTGENLVRINFSSSTNFNNLLSWPLWLEHGLAPKEQEGSDESNDFTGYGSIESTSIEGRTSNYYNWGGDVVRYWLHMWERIGNISGYTDSENNEYSRLRSKIFANLRYSYITYYNNTSGAIYIPASVRTFNYLSSQYVTINGGSKMRYYDGYIQSSLMVPGTYKYPITFSMGYVDTSDVITDENNAYLYSAEPVQLDYASSPHAVVVLPTAITETSYTQRILPKLVTDDVSPTLIDTGVVTIPAHDTPYSGVTGALIPWETNTNTQAYPYVDYGVAQGSFFIPDNPIHSGDKYLYIGEIYIDYSTNDTRYGGTSETAVRNNRFIIAGPQYAIAENDTSKIIYGNQGDTYFQRWDCLKTKPIDGAENGVIDITSVMLETHINIDGRTDLQRGISKIASLDTEQFGTLNPVYTQNNNYLVARDLDGDFNEDTYRSSITWTLEKSDSAQTDEWAHITLANNLKLDGDKGVCRALRRFQNSIIAFQDKAVSEILFNSRTQLSTTDGVPVEIANSGKVDGKRYITNKFGCINKWTIVEGKNAMYFVDNINKAFCAFNGQVENLSTRLGFDTWFRDAHRLGTWTPRNFDNLVAFYDRIYSDVYLVRDSADGMPCLVYSEALGAFTSFFDYRRVPMMCNVEDKFLSFKNGKLWSQNTGLYCNFFGDQYDYWSIYRVTPDPFGDKIWTNIDYRADFYQILDENGNLNVPDKYIINADRFFFTSDLYKENDTFTSYSVWNEYQTTGDVSITVNDSYTDVSRKKFRIWRIAVARALKHDTNKHGLDRIRNPWVNILVKKTIDNNRELMQLHDIVVKYFE